MTRTARAPRTELAPALSLLAAVARQRALIAVVSDFRGPRDWRPPLLDLAARHDVLAVEIRDPREDELVDVGEVWFSDPETGGRLRVDTSDASLRTRFAEAAAAGAAPGRSRPRRRASLARRALDEG